MKNTDEPSQFTRPSHLFVCYAVHKIPVFRSMDYTPLTEARKELDDNASLCALFRLIAIETWKRIEFAYERRDHALYETTITQNLVFAML